MIATRLKRHFADGSSFYEDLPLDQKVSLMEGRAPSPLINLTWLCDGDERELDVEVKDGKPKLSISALPESSGFICFEDVKKPDNCLLLDAAAKERMRLSVPWQLTGHQNPESAKSPTSFVDVSAPYVNPFDGRKGGYGVTAWVQYAGMYYFELDYHTGQFLWGTEIRD